jgi:hypothetical protein
MKRTTTPFHVPTETLLSDPRSIRLFADAQARRNERRGMMKWLMNLIKKLTA